MSKITNEFKLFKKANSTRKALIKKIRKHDLIKKRLLKSYQVLDGFTFNKHTNLLKKENKATKNLNVASLFFLLKEIQQYEA